MHLGYGVSLATVVLAAALAGGCTTERETKTAVGAGAGAATAAVLDPVGSGRGTAVGAGPGATTATTGAAVGYNLDLVKEKLGMATKGSRVQVAEQADGSLKVSVPGPDSFSAGGASIDPRLHPILGRIASALTEHPVSTITVVGHTDSMGEAPANTELSGRRAAAVADYLAQRGVQRSRMTVEKRGESEPIADNTSEWGRAENRRVEMVIRPPTS